MARFLADESCDFAVIRALRQAGHDVLAVVEHSPGATDQAVITLAVEQARVLITEDTDFGQLVFAHAQPWTGVILLRYPARARAELPGQVVAFVAQAAETALSAFVVLQPGRGA